MRLEKDMLGEVSLPDDCLYGIETARAAENFKVSGRRAHWEMIEAVIAVKQAAAMANRDAGLLSQEKADAILAACGDILAHRADDAFITDALQGGEVMSKHDTYTTQGASGDGIFREHQTAQKTGKDCLQNVNGDDQHAAAGAVIADEIG